MKKEKQTIKQKERWMQKWNKKRVSLQFQAHDYLLGFMIFVVGSHLRYVSIVIARIRGHQSPDPSCVIPANL